MFGWKLYIFAMNVFDHEIKSDLKTVQWYVPKMLPKVWYFCF